MMNTKPVPSAGFAVLLMALHIAAAGDQVEKASDVLPWGYKSPQSYIVLEEDHEPYSIPHLDEVLPSNVWKQNINERKQDGLEQELDLTDGASYPEVYQGSIPYVDYGSEPVPPGFRARKYFTRTNPIVGYNVFLPATHTITRDTDDAGKLTLVAHNEADQPQSSRQRSYDVSTSECPPDLHNIGSSAGWYEVALKKDLQRVIKMMSQLWGFPSTTTAFLQAALHVKETITPQLAQVILSIHTSTEELTKIAHDTRPRVDEHIRAQARLIRLDLLQRTAMTGEQASALALQALFYEGMKDRPTRQVVEHIMFKLVNPKEFLDQQNFIDQESAIRFSIG